MNQYTQNLNDASHQQQNPNGHRKKIETFNITLHFYRLKSMNQEQKPNFTYFTFDFSTVIKAKQTS